MTRLMWCAEACRRAVARNLLHTFLVLSAALLLQAQGVHAATLNIGGGGAAYQNDGSSFPSGTTYIPVGNWRNAPWRGWAAFLIPHLTGTVIGAKLKVVSSESTPAGSSQTTRLWDVTASYLELNQGRGFGNGSESPAIFNDLGSGTAYGSQTYAGSAATGAATFEVTLNAAAIAGITAVAGLNTQTRFLVGFTADNPTQKMSMLGNQVVLVLETIDPEIEVTSSEAGALTDGLTDAQGDEPAGVAKTVIYTVKNTGVDNLTLEQATMAGTPVKVAVGTISAPGKLTLAPNETTQFTVSYTPTDIGAFSFGLTFKNNDADENPFNFTVSGTATGEPEIKVASSGTEVADGGRHDLGSVPAGQARTATYEITNTGNADLTLVKAAETGAPVNVTVGTISPPDKLRLVSNETTQFTVNYTPDHDGPFSFGLTFGNNDADEAPFNFTVEGVGTADPKFTVVPADFTVNTDLDKATAMVEFTGTRAAQATDHDGVKPLTYSPASGFDFPIGPTKVTVTAEDNDGNKSTATFQVTVIDGQDPVIIADDITRDAENGKATATVTFAPTVNDNSGETITPVWVSSSPTLDLKSGSEFPIGTTTVKYKATDSTGNQAEKSFTVTVEDRQKPEINVPSDITVDAEDKKATARVEFTGANAATATDNSGNTPTLTYSPASGFDFPLGLTTVTVTATDGDNNKATATFKVIVEDKQHPVIIADDITRDAENGKATATVTFAPTASDNSGETITPVWVSSSPTAGLKSGSDFPIGTTTVTYRAADSAGNPAEKSFKVLVIDKQDPVIIADNITRRADTGKDTANVTFSPTANDNSGETVTPFWFSSSPTPGLKSGSDFPVGITTVTYRATDSANNQAEKSFTVTVQDSREPVITAPNITRQTDSNKATATVTFTVTANDTTDGSITPVWFSSSPTLDLKSGSDFPIGITTVTYRATDSTGNQAEKSFTVTVEDRQKPEINVPSDITVDAEDKKATARVEFTGANAATATDNSGNTPTLTYSPASGFDFPLGLTTVTVTATDGDNNKATATFKVIVEDKQHPVIIADDITVNAENNKATATVTFAPTASDNSGETITPVWVSSSPTAGLKSGSDFPIGTTTVTYRAADSAGNKTEKSFKVIVEDKQYPVIIADDITVDADTGKDTANVTFSPTASDNSGEPVILAWESSEQTPNLHSGSDFPVGTTTVTYKAIDSVGNTAKKSFKVMVRDSREPVITAPNIIVDAEDGKATATVTFTVTANDTTDGSITPVWVSSSPTLDLKSGSDFPIGITTVTYRATDSTGNQAEKSFTVTVEDRQKPKFTSFPADITLKVDYPNKGAVATWNEPQVSDNAPGATVTQIAGPASGSTFDIGSTTVTYEARDAADNPLKRSFTVNVSQIPPGSVTFIVKSAKDGAFTFKSPEPALNITINAKGGSGKSDKVLIRPGSYDVSFAAADNSNIAAAQCSPDSSKLDAETKKGTIVLVSGVAVTCTIDALDSRGITSGQIGSFMQARSELILANQPGIGRRLDRLNGRTGGATGISGFGLSLTHPALPFSARLGRNEGSFAWSLQNARGQSGKANLQADPGAIAGALGIPRSDDTAANNIHGPSSSGLLALGPTSRDVSYPGIADADPATDPMARRFDVWAQGTYAGYSASGGKGRFAIVHAGADYLVNPNLLIGLGLQTDWTTMDAASNDGRVAGYGFMAGPYATARLADGFYADARIAWGRSFNKISPFGTYTDPFRAERWLGSAALIGETSWNMLTIRPELRLSWFRERSKAYVDTLGVAIPAVTVETGTLEFGPTFTLKPFEIGSGLLLTPHLTVEGIWTFAQTNTATTVSQQPGLGETGVRGRVEAGLNLADDNGTSVNASAFYDGLGNADFKAWGAKLSVHKAF